MTHQHGPIHFIPETFISPIDCRYCGAHAHLMRRSPHPELNCEIRTFECMVCEKQTALTVKY